jgi:hypothetical protein
MSHENFFEQLSLSKKVAGTNSNAQWSFQTVKIKFPPSFEKQVRRAGKKQGNTKLQIQISICGGGGHRWAAV